MWCGPTAQGFGVLRSLESVPAHPSGRRTAHASSSMRFRWSRPGRRTGPGWMRRQPRRSCRCTGVRRAHAHTDGPGLKVMPQFLTNDVIGYLAKAGPKPGPRLHGRSAIVAGDMRSPAWSPDGTHVVYERVGFRPRPQNLLPLTAGTPTTSTGTPMSSRVFQETGSSWSRARMETRHWTSWIRTARTGEEVFAANGGAAFSPSWSPDGQSIVFGYGGFLQSRRQPAKIMMVRRDGTNVNTLTEGVAECRFSELVA